MSEDTSKNCPVCGGAFGDGCCPRCGFDLGQWYTRYATLSPAKGLKSMKLRQEEWRKLSRGRFKCPRCGGMSFSLLLERESLACEACGFCLGQKQLLALRPADRSGAGKNTAGKASAVGAAPSSWKEDPNNCQILMRRKQKTLTGYTGNCTDLKLEDGITAIADHAFEGCESLRQILLPPCLEEIGESAFSNCRSLRRIRIPAGVTVLRTNTFARCSQLEEIGLAEGLRRIEDNAFFCCNSLRELHVPDSLESFSRNAFRWTRRDFKLIASVRWIRLHKHALEQAEVSYLEY